jgi:translation initiation factor 3 subunit E
LLEFASQKQLYATADIEAAKLDLIGKTNMVDYAVDIYQQLHQTTDVSIYLLDFKFLDVNSNSQWYGHVYSHSL